MAQRVKGLAPKPADPGTHTVEEENHLPQAVLSALYTVVCASIFFFSLKGPPVNSAGLTDNHFAVSAFRSGDLLITLGLGITDHNVIFQR